LSKPEMISEKSICAPQAAQEAGKKHAQTAAAPAEPKQDAAKGPEPKPGAAEGTEPKQDAAKGPAPVKKKGGAPMPPMPTMAQQKVS